MSRRTRGREDDDEGERVDDGRKIIDRAGAAWYHVSGCNSLRSDLIRVPMNNNRPSFSKLSSLPGTL